MIILWVIIGDVHQFIGHCLIPLDHCIFTYPLNSGNISVVAGCQGRGTGGHSPVGVHLPLPVPLSQDHCARTRTTILAASFCSLQHKYYFQDCYLRLEIWSDKIRSEKFIFIPYVNTQNNTLCRLKLVVGMFGHST